MPWPILEISTVVGCRLACAACPQAVHVRSYSAPGRDTVMAMETFTRCLAKVPRSVEIMFAGMAEPWLNPHATAMVLQAFEHGHQVSVFTTTVGMTLATAAQLCGLPFRLFCVHLPDRDGRMRLTVGDHYLTVLRAVLTAVPGHDLTVIGPLHPNVREVVGRDVPDASPGLCSRAGLVFPVPRKTGRLRCTACGPDLDHNVLLPDGTVVLCCMQYDLRHTLGNLGTDTYASLFHGPGHALVRQGLAGDETVALSCRTCELAEVF